MFSGPFDELLKELIQKLQEMRQRHTADVSLLRQMMEHNKQMAREVSVVLEQRDTWMAQKPELKERLYNLQQIISGETGTEIVSYKEI